MTISDGKLNFVEFPPSKAKPTITYVDVVVYAPDNAALMLILDKDPGIRAPARMVLGHARWQVGIGQTYHGKDWYVSIQHDPRAIDFRKFARVGDKVHLYSGEVNNFGRPSKRSSGERA